MSHTQIIIATNNIYLQDIIIAQLAEVGYDGFEQDDESIKAYILSSQFSETVLINLLQKHELAFTQNTIEQQNWNELWEKNFEPVWVDDFVGIRAAFHQPINNVQHEIVITPKMSFGTGHHATTFMVMQLMQEINFNKKTVFDFGTGTGILAILAEKLGAINILAVDYDDWCIENAKENIEQNNCSKVEIAKADTAQTNTPFDIVIANINKNIIQDNFSLISKACKPLGQIILSGLLVADEADILLWASATNWQHHKTVSKGAWIAIHFSLVA